MQLKLISHTCVREQGDQWLSSKQWKSRNFQYSRSNSAYISVICSLESWNPNLVSVESQLAPWVPSGFILVRTELIKSSHGSLYSAVFGIMLLRRPVLCWHVHGGAMKTGKVRWIGNNTFPRTFSPRDATSTYETPSWFCNLVSEPWNTKIPPPKMTFCRDDSETRAEVQYRTEPHRDIQQRMLELHDAVWCSYPVCLQTSESTVQSVCNASWPNSPRFLSIETTRL